jgi:hypothetical protein
VSALINETYVVQPIVAQDVWDGLNKIGYALTTDESIGLPPKYSVNFRNSYFTDSILRRDEGDWPIDRKRARDVIHYQWDDDGQLVLREHDSITLVDRADIEGVRDHARVRLLDDPEGRNLVARLLSLVPPERRRAHCTFGVNLFRTFTDVVTKPHKDDEEFIIIYVLNRDGDGAETRLYDAKTEPGCSEPVLTQQLNPGDLIIFEDNLFFHEATPLISPPGGTAMRDALICTVDYQGSYGVPAGVDVLTAAGVPAGA